MKIKVKKALAGEKGVLIACDSDSQIAIDSLNAPVELSMKNERSSPYHRRFFAMINLAYKFWNPVYQNKFVKKADEFLIKAGLNVDNKVIGAFNEVFNKELKSYEPTKNFEQFRSDITILSGFFDVVYRIDGTERVIPKSIAFNKMQQKEFNELFVKVKSAIYKYVLHNVSEQDKAIFENEINNF